MSFNQVLGLLRKADERFSMIGDGDKGVRRSVGRKGQSGAFATA